MANESQSSVPTPQETPGKVAETPKDEPRYTESQWRSMQANIRKEIQPLKDQIRKLEADNLALSAQNDDLDTNSKVLQEKVASLTQEIDEGIPGEAKDVVAKYRELRDKTIKWQAEVKKEIAKHDEIITEATNMKLDKEATRLSEKFGIDKDTLLNFKDIAKMKEYAVDNFDPSSVAPKTEVAPVASPEPVSPPEAQVSLPKPESPVSAGGISDMEFIKQYAAGLSDDHAHYREVVNKKTID